MSNIVLEVTKKCKSKLIYKIYNVRVTFKKDTEYFISERKIFSQTMSISRINYKHLQLQSKDEISVVLIQFIEFD